MADEPDTTEQPNSPETEKPEEVTTPTPSEDGGEKVDEAPKPDAPADEDAPADGSLMTGKGPDDEDEKEDEPDEAAQLPESYELTPPEGFEINDELLAEATPVFKDIGLSNEQANRLMPLVPKFANALFAQQNDAFQAQATDWAKEAKKDPELGGKNWSETENLVARALDKFATGDEGKSFRTLLDETKLGNHPAMIRMFRRIGAALGEDGDMPRSDAAAQTKLDRLEALYPNDVPKAKEGAS